MKPYADHEKFLSWLQTRLIAAGRGEKETNSQHDPSGRFWLGRLASEETVINNFLGERGERLEPCASGIRLRPSGKGPWTFNVRVYASIWLKREGFWEKRQAFDHTDEIRVSPSEPQDFFNDILVSKLQASTEKSGLSAKVRVEFSRDASGSLEMDVLLVNTSPEEHQDFKDTRLYETGLEISGCPTEPFILTALPDSFRYDRRVNAYGINGGVDEENGTFYTTDIIIADKYRPNFWGSDTPCPEFSFSVLSEDPFPSLNALASALRNWGQENWSEERLSLRGEREGWTKEMRRRAQDDAIDFWKEYDRLIQGISVLYENAQLLNSFKLMNQSMKNAARGKGYDSWRPFQVGFIVSNLKCIVNPDEETEIADIVWFATGGGKTETYLGLLITASLFDRQIGKKSGITAWTRFPLRMLSLQQLQRFADAMAAAEISRRDAGIGGDSFSVGFFVGQGATPNTIPTEPKDNQPDPDDETMPAKYQVLQRCPFCGNKSLKMEFDRRLWRLNHRCDGDECAWGNEPLPFFIVDDEIYRFLPTIVVGTLDKAASIGMQGSMRGFVGAPMAMCSRPGHGFTYASRSNRPNGCLVPGCTAATQSLPQAEDLFPPSYRLQDELHLLRDSLGAVDAHYEALLDGLELELAGRRPKILGSSATLEGYKQQVDVLYRREGRVFPQPSPEQKSGFWTVPSDQLMRRFIALAPRGLTIEFVLDRLLTELQTGVRLLLTDPEKIIEEIGIHADSIPELVSLYGTNVVYGNTLRDLDAVDRSLRGEQVQVIGELHKASLTGRTDFEDVRQTLERLEKPEQNFFDRIHIITASAMMSHGVDIDRLNVMAMIGLPLGTAEFIQATARVGRRFPGIVFVIHKIGRERDAGIFRSFKKFVEQGDRFVEPVPITRKSRRVLDRTISGLELSRLLMIHEPKLKRSLATLKNFADAISKGDIKLTEDVSAICKYLGLDPDQDITLIKDIEDWFDRFQRNVNQPLSNMRFPGDASPSGRPMMSLRDVEEQVPIHLERF